MYMHVGERQGNIEVRTKMAMMPVQAKCVQLGHIKQGNVMQRNNTLRQLTFSLFSLEKKWAAPGGIPTHLTVFSRPVLCPLSYRAYIYMYLLVVCLVHMHMLSILPCSMASSSWQAELC